MIGESAGKLPIHYDSKTIQLQFTAIRLKKIKVQVLLNSFNPK